jgi:hypothetical protein
MVQFGVIAQEEDIQPRWSSGWIHKHSEWSSTKIACNVSSEPYMCCHVVYGLFQEYSRLDQTYVLLEAILLSVLAYAQPQVWIYTNICPFASLIAIAVVHQSLQPKRKFFKNGD